MPSCYSCDFCQLSNEQLRLISRETEQTLAEFVQDIVEQNTGLRPRGSSSSPDATKQLQERLAIVIKRHLSSERWASTNPRSTSATPAENGRP